MPTSDKTDILMLFVLGVIVADVVFRHVKVSHEGMDQKLYDREFRGITENYYA